MFAALILLRERPAPGSQAGVAVIWLPAWARAWIWASHLESACGRCVMQPPLKRGDEQLPGRGCDLQRWPHVLGPSIHPGAPSALLLLLPGGGCHKARPF